VNKCRRFSGLNCRLPCAIIFLKDWPVEDLYQLKLWRESEPEAPEGVWYKDFGSFKICGEGKYPKTFLLRGQAAKGKKL
jgi:hypothetical protein